MKSIRKSDSSNTLTFVGVDVEITSINDQQPFVSYGVYKITNNSDVIQDVTLSKIFLDSESNKMPIEKFRIYILPDYNENTSSVFSIEPKEEVTIRVTFDRILVTPSFKERYKISVVFTSNSIKHSVESNLIFVQEHLNQD